MHIFRIYDEANGCWSIGVYPHIWMHQGLSKQTVDNNGAKDNGLVYGAQFSLWRQMGD